MSNDARRKLRDMGGIMASSPDLIQAVQKFQVGGPVMGPPPSAPVGPNFSPRMPPKPLPGIRPNSLQVPPLPGTIPVVPRELIGEVRRRALAGTAPSFGMGMGAGLGSLNPILEDDIGVDDLLAATEGDSRRESESEKFRENLIGGTARAFYEGPLSDIAGFAQRATGLGLDVLGGAASVLGMDRISAQLERQSDRLYNQATSNIMRGVSATAGMDPADFDMEPAQFNKIIMAAEETTPPPGGGEGTPDAPLSPEETVMAQPLVPENISDETLDRMRKLIESDPNVSPPPPGGGGDGSGGTPTKKDLRSLYKEQLGLFKEIYGTNDEDEARDRAMSLAMIGLAIAAGQSPNALTNIAQGTMVGLQAMGDRREAVRERERGMKTLALQTAIDQMSGEAQADASAARMEQEQANRLELEREKARLRGDGYGGGGGFKYEPPPLVAEVYNKRRAELDSAAGEDPSIVPEQYGENTGAWADLEARKSSKDYLRTLLPQIPESEREAAMLSGQELLYPDPTGLRIVQNPGDLVFILPDQEFVFLDRTVDPPTYVRQKKVVDPETGRFKAVPVE